MPPTELPSAAVVLTIGALVVVVALGATVFFMLRKFRDGLAQELRMSIKAAGERQPVDIVQPFEIKPATRFATHDELRAIALRVERVEEKFEEAVKTITDAGEDRGNRIHARIDLVLEAVAEVRGELKRIPHN